MIYDEFVDAMGKLNPSNCFAKGPGEKTLYNRFYELYDPHGVEFELDIGNVFMVPYGKIKKLTEEYSYTGCDYVFALNNGEPIFVKEGKVYTCCNGTDSPRLELLADSYEDFLKLAAKEGK